EDGGLFALDLTNRAAGLARIGQHSQCCPIVLEGSDDGSLVVFGVRGNIGAWDRASARAVWHRDDWSFTGGAFIPGTNRFLTATAERAIIEHDPVSGATVKMWNCHSLISPIAVAVSPGGQTAAIIDTSHVLVLLNLVSGEP